MRRNRLQDANREFTDPEGALQVAETVVRSTIDGFRFSSRFHDVETFCLFLGYPRSGHTLVGSLLNAHAEAVVAHELDVLRYVELGLRRRQLFALLLDRDQQFATIGRQWSGYDYEVAGQHQGRCDRLRVIGDKRAASATNRLAERPDLLDRLRRVAGVPVRLIHVVRNPYDNIATMSRRRGADLSYVITRYGRLGGIVEDLRARVGDEGVLDVRYEEFVGHPERSLREVCAFLGLAASESYLADCARVVRQPLSRSRDSCTWSVADRQAVETLIAERAVLAGYDFGDADD